LLSYFFTCTGGHPNGSDFDLTPLPDMAGFDVAYKKLIRVADLQDVISSFVMEVIKSSTAFSLD
jgi:hypothetical protein